MEVTNGLNVVVAAAVLPCLIKLFDFPSRSCFSLLFFLFPFLALWWRYEAMIE